MRIARVIVFGSSLGASLVLADVPNSERWYQFRSWGLRPARRRNSESKSSRRFQTHQWSQQQQKFSGSEEQNDASELAKEKELTATHDRLTNHYGRNETAEQSKMTNNAYGRIASKSPSSLLGSLASLSSNKTTKRILKRWVATSFRIGLSILVVRLMWRTIYEILQELGTENERGGIKPSAIAQALDDAVNKRQESKVPGLVRIIQRLHYLLGWPIYYQQDGKASIDALLHSLTRSEFDILEQCLYMHSSDSNNVQNLWNGIHGLPDVQHSLLDRLSAMRYCKVHNPFAPILDQNTNAGILLYGPPGCGKTLMLTALCASVRMPCLVLTPSVFLRKYFGETNQRIRALFSLAEKLGHCVVCLDELDGLLRERRADEHDAVRELKTEFLQWWDGMVQKDSKILLVGATNRPFEVDAAVLRRMPQLHFVGQPSSPVRQSILQSFLDKIPTDPNMSIIDVVAMTDGYTPSDLMQLLQTAVLQGPMRDARYNNNPNGQYRPLTMQDLYNALQVVKPTPLSPEYKRSLIEFHHRQRGESDPTSGQAEVQMTPFGNFYHLGTMSLDQRNTLQSNEIQSQKGQQQENDDDELDDSWEYDSDIPDSDSDSDDAQ